MKHAIFIVASLLLIWYLVYLWQRWRKKYNIKELLEPSKLDNFGASNKPQELIDCASNQGGCAGCAHGGQCEMSQNPLKKHQAAPVYYDDEELDACSGMNPETYSPAQEALFEEIFSSLLPEDRAGWFESLKQRGIALPCSWVADSDKFPIQ